MASKDASSWSDLPSDLLGLILARLHSLTDRIRVGAVCRPWRSGARQRLPPPMPWVALGDKAYLDVVNINAAVHKLSLDVPRNAIFCGSAGHLLFFTRPAGGCFLADPFSGAVLPVADLDFFVKEHTRDVLTNKVPHDDHDHDLLRQGTYPRCLLHVQKVVLLWPPHGSSSPSSEEEPLVAAMIKDDTNHYEETIFVCRAGTGVRKESYDSAMSSVNINGELHTIEIGESSAGNNPAITDVKRAIDSNYDEYMDLEDYMQEANFGVADNEYLVESGDQLLKLERWAVPGSWPRDETGRFDVYEADLGASPCQWKPTRSLRGRALFLGRYCSSFTSSVPVGNGGAEEDCIYFVRRTGDSGVYNIRSGKMRRPLVPDMEVMLKQRSRRPWWSPTWVFPDQSRVSAGSWCF